MPRLPPELAAVVVEEAQYEDCLPNTKWLRNYALVCRSWCPEAQSHLFRRPILLGGAKQCLRFYDTLSGKYSPDALHTAFLRSCVKTLRMSMDHQTVYVDIILLCPNLFELDVRMHHGMIREESLAGLRLAASIRAVHVRSSFYKPMHDLLQALPSIQYLAIDARGTRGAAPRLDPLWKLRELRLFCLPSMASELFTWVMPSSNPNREPPLEVLHVYSSKASFLPDEQSKNMDSLRSLHVESITIADLAHLCCLEELSVSTIPPREVLSSLPNTLRHLRLQFIPDSQIGDVIGGLEEHQKNSNQALRVLTYTKNSSVLTIIPANDEDVRGLHRFCLDNGVMLRLMDPPYGMFRGEFEPLGYILQFPRDMPISSRRKPLLKLVESSGSGISSTKQSRFRRVTRAAKITTVRFGRSLYVDPLSLARP